MKKSEITTEDVQTLNQLIQRINDVEKNGMVQGGDVSFNSVGVTKNLYVNNTSSIKIKRSASVDILTIQLFKDESYTEELPLYYHYKRVEDKIPYKISFLFQHGLLSLYNVQQLDEQEAIFDYALPKDVVYILPLTSTTNQRVDLFKIDMLETSFPTKIPIVPSTVDIIQNSFNNVGDIGTMDITHCTTNLFSEEDSIITSNFNGTTTGTLVINENQWYYYTHHKPVIRVTGTNEGVLIHNENILIQVSIT